MLMKRKIQLGYLRSAKFLKDLIKRSFQNNVFDLGAQMSYYFILAFFPFLIFIIALLSYTSIASETAVQNLAAYMPPDIYKIVFRIIQETVISTNRALLSGGALSAIWLASSGVEVLIKGLNNSYGFTNRRSFLRRKAIAIIFTFLVAVSYILFLGVVVFGGLILDRVEQRFPAIEVLIWFGHFIRFVLPGSTIFLVLLGMYYVMPCERLSVLKVIPGAIFATAGWMLISSLFSLYIDFVDTAQSYGSIGGVIILLAWIYWSGLVILMGSEINAQVYHFQHRGKRRF